MSFDDPRLNRRSLLTATSVLAVSSVLAKNATAQTSATPEATPVTSVQDPALPEQLGPTIPPELESDPTDWPTAQGNLKATRSAQGSSISSETIEQLEVAWRFKIEEPGLWGGMTANPLVLGDRVYLIDSQSNVFALEKETGELVWKAEFGENNGGPNGMAVGYGRMVISLGDSGSVAGLDLETGDELWRSQITNNISESIELAPVIYDQTAYVSTNPTGGGVSYRGGGRGVIHAIEVATGTTIWTFDTTTDNLWGGPKVNSGGGLWYPVSIDDNGHLYFGVGNAAPWPGTPTYPNASSRPGPNDYASSMVSLDATTGAVRWYINAKPADLFDLDFQNTPVLTTVEIDGVDTKVAVGSGKTGTVIAANAETGEELWRAVVGEHENDELEEIDDTYTDGNPLRVLPGSLGGVETPIAYQDGVIYVPIVNMASYYTATGSASGGLSLEEGTGEVLAVDAATGEVLWKTIIPSGEFCGVVVVNDVVFGGGIDGVIRAFSTNDGSILWTHQANAGLNAPFAVSGDYLLVPAAGPLIPSEETDESAIEEPRPEVIAFRTGGSATPEV